jgi:lipopolysaccharide export system protein LptA
VTGPVLVAVAALAAAPSSGSARPAPAPSSDALRRGPVRVDADEVQYAFQKREVTFSGQRPVTLTRDDATLTCRRIVAVTDEAGQILTATCTGDVRFTRAPRTVTCDHATFENATDRVVCEGNAVLRDAGTEAHGTRLVYDLRADEAKLEGAIITVPGEEIDQRQREIEARRKERRR